MNKEEEILKEFDRKVNYENYLNRDEGEIPHEKVRAFIEEAIDQAKLERTEEILRMLPRQQINHLGENYGYYCEGFNECLAQIKELLTKPNDPSKTSLF